MWIRCKGNCLQLLGFWIFFVFFRFFPLKLVYFWTKSWKNTYGCFFHSFCATYFNFGTNWKNEITNFKNSDFCKLCAISMLDIKNNFANFDSFCKKEACDNCGPVRIFCLENKMLHQYHIKWKWFKNESSTIEFTLF